MLKLCVRNVVGQLLIEYFNKNKILFAYQICEKLCYKHHVIKSFTYKSAGPDDSCDPVVARNWARIPAGSDICHQGSAYNMCSKLFKGLGCTVLTTSICYCALLRVHDCAERYVKQYPLVKNHVINMIKSITQDTLLWRVGYPGWMGGGGWWLLQTVDQN